MSQHDFDIANQGMPAGRADLNGALQALASTSIGATAPATPYIGQQWIDNSGTPWLLRLYDGAGWIVAGQIDPAIDAFRPTFPRNHIAGLITANSGADPDHDVDIAVGECRDAANSFDIVVDSPITVAIDQSGANGLDTGVAAADSLYANWIVADSNRVNGPAGLFSTSFTAPVMPAGYDKRRLNGFVVTNGAANIRQFIHRADVFQLMATISDVLDAAMAPDTFKTGTLSVPPNSMALFFCRVAYSAAQATARVHVRPVGSTYLGNTPTSAIASMSLGTVNAEDVVGQGQCMVDGSSQVEYAVSESGGTATARIDTYGAIMLTRSEP